MSPAARPALAGAEVAVYFGDGLDRIYQLDQWLLVLEALDQRHRVVLMLRNPAAAKELASRTTLQMVCEPDVVDLWTTYDESDFKVCIYVNNSYLNFDSLHHPRMLHIHVNHGESDKKSSFSNQVKAYDRVFVAGPVALDRYREALIAFDDRRVVMVGRPQLDLDFEPGLAASPRQTVMYAPTWEGGTPWNNWTSLDRFGVAIVEQSLALPHVRLIYKPHPRVAASKTRDVAHAHKKIVKLIEAADHRDPDAGHQTHMDGNILAMFGQVDALVGDISSVTLDFLYLRPECPLFLTDRQDDRARLDEVSPLTSGVDVVASDNIAGFATLLASRLVDDSRGPERARTRERYFGNLQPGDSSRQFDAAVDKLVATRDALLEGRRRVTTGNVDTHG